MGSEVRDLPNSFEHSRSPYYRWSVSSKPVLIQLKLDVIDHLGDDVIGKFIEIDKPGAEIGGILLGQVTTEGDQTTFTVDDYELITCDYGSSPLFSLSDEHKARIVDQLFSVKTSSPHSAIGYFRSHTRKDLYVSKEDVSTIHEFFPGPETIFLLIKPFARKPSRAGFFIWEGNQIHTESSYLEFPFKRSELVIRSPQNVMGAEGTLSSSDPVAEPLLTLEIDGTRPELNGRPRCAGDLPSFAPLDLATPAVQQRPKAPAQPFLQSRMIASSCQKSETIGGDADVPDSDKDLEAELTCRSESSDALALTRNADLQQRCLRYSLAPNARSLPAAERQDPPNSWNVFTNVGPAFSGSVQDREEPVEQSAPATRTLNGISKSRDAQAQAAAEDISASFRNAGQRPKRRSAKLLVSFFGLVTLGAGYLSYRTIGPAGNARTTSPLLGLAMSRSADGIVLRWNHKSKLVTEAQSGFLHVWDGGGQRTVPLGREELHSGSVMYFPSTQDVSFGLEIRTVQASPTLTEWIGTSEGPDLVDSHGLDDRHGAAASVGTHALSLRQPEGVPTQIRAAQSRVPPAPSVRDDSKEDRERLDASGRSASLEPPKLIRALPAAYPAGARTAHVWGVVRVRVVVAIDGTVKEATAISGPMLLRDAALNAARGFVYEPGRLGTRAVEWRTSVDLNFLSGT